MSKLEKITRLSKQALDMYKYKKLSKKYIDDPKYKDMWLISERGVEAKDNGFAFFKYLRTNHPEVNAWYVIDPSYELDYEKVKPYGNIIEFNSLDHKIAFILCKYAISTHTGYLEPWSYTLYKMLIDRNDEKFFVFMQHGVIFANLSDYLNGSNKFDLFITTTKREYEYLSSDVYGFDDGVVVKTGIARYDNLLDFKTKNQILLMPTWRKGLVIPSYMNKGVGDKEAFKKSDYFKAWNSFINNKRLVKMLDDNDIDLIFYPHFEMQPYLDCFDMSSDRVVFADKDKYDVQTLLKESKMMITDLSSVLFDMAYMKKPVIYYQKVKEDCYREGYMDFATEAFGELVFEEGDLMDCLEYYFENDFVMKKEFEDRVDATFTYRDSKNSQRIYEEILKLKK